MREPRKRELSQPSTAVQAEAEQLGERVRAARRRLGLGQDDVAFVAHVSPRTVFAIEKGKPTVRFDMLARVLAAVGLRIDAQPRDRVWQPPQSEDR